MLHMAMWALLIGIARCGWPITLNRQHQILKFCETRFLTIRKITFCGTLGISFPCTNYQIFSIFLIKAVRKKPLPHNDSTEVHILSTLITYFFFYSTSYHNSVSWFLQNILYIIINSNKSNSNEKSVSNLHVRPSSKARPTRMYKTGEPLVIKGFIKGRRECQQTPLQMGLCYYN